VRGASGAALVRRAETPTAPFKGWIIEHAA